MIKIWTGIIFEKKNLCQQDGKASAYMQRFFRFNLSKKKQMRTLNLCCGAEISKIGWLWHAALNTQYEPISSNMRLRPELY